jgi:aminomethyltransferase
MALEGFKLTYDFGDPTGEAMRCRTDCALFDFSFLESARITGNRARDLIEMFTGRSMATLGESEIFYALRVDSAGRINADWTVWKTGENSFDVMSGRREDILDLLSCSDPGVAVVDMTADRATFAVQGPRALDVLHKLGDVGRIGSLKYYTFDRACLEGIPCTIGRLGYTGEPGFEIIVERGQARDLWDALSSHVAAAGFIAADMLRIEAGFVLFSNEFRLPVSPSEVGLGKFSRPADPLKPAIKLVSFLADADRQSWPWRPSRDPQRPSKLGAIAVTSACDSVAAGGILGLGYVLAETSPNTVLHDEVGTFRNIRLTPRPFYDTAKRRPREPWLQSGGRQLR